MEDSYINNLTKRLNEKQVEVKKSIRKSNQELIKKMGLILLVIFFSFLSHLLGLNLPPSFIMQEKFDLDKKVQNYEVSLSGKGNYEIGLYLGREFGVQKYKNDANYTLEYYNNGKLFRKYKFHRWTKDMIMDRGAIPFETRNRHEMLIFDYIHIPKDFKFEEFTVKIIIHQNFSMFEKVDKEKRDNISFIVKNRSEIFYPNKSDEELKEIEKFLREMYPHNIKITELYDTNQSKLPLLKALFNKDRDTVKKIIEEDNGIGVETILGAEAEIRRSNQRTALFYASYFNDIPTLEYLISKGANIRHRDITRKYPIAYAMENNSIEAVKYFFNLGIKPSEVNYLYNKKVRSNYAPLNFAFSIGSYELSKLLIDNNATSRYPNIKSIYKNKDIYRFLYDFDNYKEMLDLLLKYKIESDDKPSKERLKEFYDSRKKNTSENAPINQNLAYEDMNINIYYEQIFFQKQKHENMKKKHLENNKKIEE